MYVDRNVHRCASRGFDSTVMSFRGRGGGGGGFGGRGGGGRGGGGGGFGRKC